MTTKQPSLPEPRTANARGAGRLRVAYAENFTSPYVAPLHAQLSATPGWDYRVFVSCRIEFDRQWRVPRHFPFAHKVSAGFSYRRTVIHAREPHFADVRQIHLPLGLWADLWAFRPDAVVSTEMGMRSVLCAGYCAAAGKPLVLLFEGSRHTSRDITWKQRLLRRPLVSRAAAFIARGQCAKEYVESLGAEPRAIFDVKYPAMVTLGDGDRGRARRDAVRSAWGVDGLCYLCVGDLIPRKAVDRLLAAWHEFSRGGDVRAHLVIVGDGPERSRLEGSVAALGMENVLFTGFKQPHELPAIYCAGDVLVFPTLEDAWGLVVNEAMACGLPVICSKYAGCAPDLIVHGENGWLTDPLDRDDLARKLRAAWDARHGSAAMAEAARRAVAPVTVEATAHGMRQAVHHALGKARRSRREGRCA